MYFISVAIFAVIIFSPFNAATGVAQQSRTYQLADVFAFFVSFQCGYAVQKLFFPDLKATTGTGFLIGLTFFICIVAWIYGIRLVWRLGIQAPSKRIALLGLVMPFGIIIPAIAFPILNSSWTNYPFFLRLAVLIALSIVLRCVSLWILERGQNAQTTNNAE